MARLRQWPAAVDGAVDGAVVCFALWTVWYQVALAAQFDLRPSGWPFLLAGVAVTALFAAWEVREVRAQQPPDPPPDPSPGRGPIAAATGAPARASARSLLVWAVGVVGVALAVVLRVTIGVLPAAALGIVLVAVAVRRRVATSAAAGEPGESDDISLVEHAIAGLLSLGLGVLSLFLVKYDADDVFYVNRVAWVTDHGTAALNDTMFAPDTLTRSTGVGLPTPSIEALQGVLAHLLGIAGATTAYLVYAPLLATVFGWVTWRLVRAWAPRRHLLVMVVAVLFVLASASSIVGSYSIGRIWQGKVTAYAVLLPLFWLWLTRVAVRPQRRTLALLAAGGVAFVGLTTTSALVAPVLLAGALLAALVRRSRALALAGLAFVAGPIVNGVVQVLAPADVGDGVTRAASARQVFDIAFGPHTAMATLGVVAIVLAVLVVRGPAAPVVAAAAVVALAPYLPGIIRIADAVTGAGPVVWRLAILAPMWVFVGLLVAAPLPAVGWAPRGLRSGRLARPVRAGVALACAALVVAVPILGGTWLWSSQVGGDLASSPSWKVPPDALADVRAARELDVRPGRWLLPPMQMQVLAISTAGPFGVAPRALYVPSLHTSSTDQADRQALYALVSRQHIAAPAEATVRRALDRLDVSLACVPEDTPGARHLLGEVTGARLRHVGSMWCHVPAP